ncbi:hypothetical protein ACMHYB_17045 [Sorangium sp. So ce1128]
MRIASSGAIGIGIAVALLIAVRMLAPPAQRGKLRLPVVLLCFHVAALLARLPLAPTSSLHRTLSVVSLFFLLTALGRAAFLLVVDLILGVRLGRPLPGSFTISSRGSSTRASCSSPSAPQGSSRDRCSPPPRCSPR